MDHLTYRWAHDKNQALEDEESMAYFLELPEKVQMILFRDYMFVHFLEVFKVVFRIKNQEG